MSDRITCTRCSASYDPSLTRWACPVCDEIPADLSAKPDSRRIDDPDDRLIAIVAGATLANVLLMAILALAVLHS